MLIENKNKDKLIHLIECIEPSQFKGLTTKIKYLYPAIFNDIKNIQIQLNIKTFSEILFLIINDLDRVPICPGLSKKCKKKLNFKNIIDGYYPYCKCCSSMSNDFKIKRKETNLLKYGCEFPNCNENIKKKIVSTVNTKYGVNNIKQIKNER